MKKILLSMGACTLALAGLTSCQQDSVLNEEPTVVNNEELGNLETITFDVAIPDNIRTRAEGETGDLSFYGDGSKIEHLRYAIYLYPPTVPDEELKSVSDNKWTKLITSEDTYAPQATKSGNNFKLEVDIPSEFKVVAFFWADHYGNNDVYDIDYINHTVTVDYNRQYQDMFEDYGDAFTGVFVRNSVSNDFVQGSVQKQLLYRPFCQISVLTDEDQDNMNNLLDNHIAPAIVTMGRIDDDVHFSAWNFFNNTFNDYLYFNHLKKYSDIPLKQINFKNRNMRLMGLQYVFVDKDIDWNPFSLNISSNSGSGYLVNYKDISLCAVMPNSRLIFYNRESEGPGDNPSLISNTTTFKIEYVPTFNNDDTIEEVNN